jgi:PE-PPE domain
LDTPEGFYPTTGVNSLTADASEAQGAQILDGAITDAVEGTLLNIANLIP